jgi:hypothetical protein
MSAVAVPPVRVHAGPPARPSRAVVGLGWLIAFLSLLAAGTGLLSSGGPGRRAFTTVHGQTVELYGRGLYQHDTVFAAAGQRGGDVVMVFIGVPLLILSLTVYRRGTAWSRLLLTGTLAYFLYVYASAALGTVAYNSLYLLYVVIASAALYAFLLAFPTVEPASWRPHADKHGPRRFAAVFMLISAGVTATVWTLPLLGALWTGAPPDRLDSYSTPVTYALDIAVITPAAAIAGLLILRRRWLGHVWQLPCWCSR